VGGSHCLWCSKSRWKSPLGTSIALKIGKIGLEARKLWPPEVGGVDFTKQILNQIAHNLFPNLSKNL